MNEIEEIKTRLPIEELVWEYVHLKKAWKSYKWLCPWHQEKTPSFTVSPENQMCWCFWCQKWWDIFNFLQYTEGLDFRESLEVLAEKTWVKINKWNFEKKEDKNSILEILEVINTFYKNELSKNQEARKYLEDRDIWKEIVEKFDIWYSPSNSNILFSFLLKKWFSKDEIFKTWVFSSSNFDWNDAYDRFNSRIVFPIKNVFWKTIWFWWRVFWNAPKNQAKYLNSPEWPVFDKSNNLYALNFAKEEIKKKWFVVLTEGYMDTIACHKVWVTNAVASLWTAFNDKHVKVLKRYTDNFYICFDQDNAWVEALKRAVELLSSFDVNVRVILLPFWKDPDECIKKDKDSFISAVENPVTIIDYLFEKLSLNFDLSKTEDKKSLQKEIFKVISLSKNNIDKFDHLKRFSNLLSIPEKAVLEDFESFSKSFRKAPKKKDSVNLDKEKISPAEYLFWLFLANENFWNLIKENFLIDYLEDNYLKSVYKKLFDEYNGTAIVDSLDLDTKNKLLKFKIFAESAIIDDNEDKIKAEFLKTINKVNLDNLEKRERFLKSKLGDNRDFLNEFVKITSLKKELKK